MYAQEFLRSKTFDLRCILHRIEVLQYVAGIYRALLVAQKHFEANPISLNDAQNVWIGRADDCHIMHLAVREKRGWSGRRLAFFCVGSWLYHVLTS